MECLKCGKENVPNIAYCTTCGNSLLRDNIDYTDENKKYFVQTIVLFLCVVLIILSSIVTGLSFIEHEYVFSGLLIITTMVFVFLDFREFAKIFRFTFHLKPILQIIFGAPILAVIVIYVARYLNSALGFEETKYFTGYLLFTSNVYLYGILFVALIPGFVEEFLFRGILFNHLLRLTSPKATIIITGLLFAFIHFSFFSLIWLVSIGIYLGYLRFRYRTIFYGIFFHVLYNGSIFFLEMIL